MADLTTLANVRQYLNSTGVTANATDDALLTRLVSAASAFVQRWLDRDFLLASYVETRSGTGTTLLIPRQFPVVSVTQLSIDGVSIPARGSSVIASGYFFDDDYIYLNGYEFSRGRANVVITYQAGYSVVPFDVEQGVIEIVALRYRERDRIGLASKGLNGEQTNFILKDIPASARMMFEQYKRVVPT